MAWKKKQNNKVYVKIKTQLLFLYKTHQKNLRLEHFRRWPPRRKNSHCAGKMFSVGHDSSGYSFCLLYLFNQALFLSSRILRLLLHKS
ncbi:hypothetical protein P8452_45219 [Trifolium repens]|nr:hypothetical protein P8452_45219 [Trifolium repens]